MTVSIKDGAKFFGISVMACCAVLVCNMFLNYDVDLRSVAGLVDEPAKPLYDALLLNNKVVCLVSGLCLALTAVVMLIFYIGQYIEAHSQKFGILKALGYTDLQIASRCAVFGVCVLVGAVAGYALSWAIMGRFYVKQNEGNVGIPTVVMHFQPVTLLLIILPALLFSALSVGIALLKLRIPVLSLVRGEVAKEKKVKLKKREGKKQRPFLKELAFSVIREKKVLAFFVAFGGFCFSAMMLMGLSMRDYASDMMGIMVMLIGLVLACVSLWLAMSTLVKSNAKKIAMLKVNGYGSAESGLAVLGMYCIPAVIGFAVGAVYQWGLLNVMVNVVFASFDDVPAYSFDWTAFAICLPVFIVAYALLNATYAFVIGRTPIKSVMSE